MQLLHDSVHEHVERQADHDLPVFLIVTVPCTILQPSLPLAFRQDTSTSMPRSESGFCAAARLLEAEHMDGTARFGAVHEQDHARCADQRRSG
jgi:hypothetical protein